MRSLEIEDVWSMVDREALVRIARTGPPVVFATVSGAHLYGFASRDSDVDLRGAFLRPLRELLGLRPPPETITITGDRGLDLDWVAHDVRKFARLLTQHNGYVLEQLYSPLVVVATPALEQLRQVARGCITRPTVRHYLGFAHGRRQRLQEPAPTVKHLLYAYRVLLSGIHLMRTGEVVAHIGVLNEAFVVPAVTELVQRKREGGEALGLDPAEVAHHERLLDGLEAELMAAHAASSLPEEPTTRADLEDLVVRLRLEAVT